MDYFKLGDEMNCKRCHKKLKNPKSVQQGYGPTCLRKIQAATDAGGEPGDVGYKSLAERSSKTVNEDNKDHPQIWTTAHGRTVIL
jgi:hypothetical protein